MRCFFVLLSASALGLGCNSTGDGGGDPDAGPAPIEQVTQLRGRVSGPDGQAVEARIQASGQSQETTALGRYALDLSAGAHVVRAEAEGYLPAIKRVEIIDGAPTMLDLVLRPEAEPVALNAAEGGEVEGARGAAIKAPAGAFVDRDRGVTIDGVVQVHLTPIDPSNDEDMASAPGDLTADEDGEVVLLESYGMLTVNVRQGGAELQVADGARVEIRIPAPEGVTDPPETMPLWHFDEEAGRWSREGEATWDAEQGIYVGEVGHFSSWNCDDVATATCVTGIAYDEDGRPLAGARVTARGVDYNGMTEATTDADGRFRAAVRRGSTVDITVIHREGGGQTRQVESGQAPTAVPPGAGAECLDVGEWRVTRDVYRGVDGTSITCSEGQDPLEGVCMREAFEHMGRCFNPEGQCTISADYKTMRWANGARMEMSGLPTAGAAPQEMTYEYISPTGEICATARVEALGQDGASTTMTVNGQDYRIEHDFETETETIHCPDGSTHVLDRAQQEALEACSGGEGDDDEEMCALEGGNPQAPAFTDAGLPQPGGMGTPCTASECNEGLICCQIQIGEQTQGVCADQQTCALMQQSASEQ